MKPHKDLIYHLLRLILRSVHRRTEARQIMAEICGHQERRKAKRNPAELKTAPEGAPLFDVATEGPVGIVHEASAPGAVQRETSIL